MKVTNQINRSLFRYLSLALLAGPGFLMAQDQQQPPPPAPQDMPQPQSAPHGGWRRADSPPPPSMSTDQTADRSTAMEQGYPAATPRDEYGAPMSRGQQQGPGGTPAGGPPMQQMGSQQWGPPPQPQGPPPAQLTLRPGTYITVRVNQPLSSDHNQPGDAFTATLVRPIVVDGFVVAQRGETIGGRVAEAKKAGRVEGTSRLAVQLTDLTLVDGQQVPIQSQLISRSGPTSVGRDVGAIGGTTALGAAVGAAADWGRGAAIGAGAGAAVGIVGVLLTRGHPTIIYPEQVLTFRIEAPVTISTERAPQAFHYVEPEDYEPGYQGQPNHMMTRGGPGPYSYYAYSPGYYPYGYGYGYAPYFWGPGFGFYYGPSFYFRGYYGHGFYRGGYHLRGRR